MPRPPRLEDLEPPPPGRAAPRRGKTAGAARGEKNSRRLNSRPAAAPKEIPVTWLYGWIAWMFLVPACVITTITLADAFGVAMGREFWRTPPFWFFALGCVLWIIAFLWLPRPVRLYVWAHEMTHAIFVILCGGKVTRFHVTPEGGHILTNKNNVLIALSPYFVPLYSLFVAGLSLLAGAFFDLTAWIPLVGNYGFRPLWVVFLLTGVTWAFHFTFTVWMIGKDQPDLRINGVFFSLTLIYLLNILLLGALLIMTSPAVTLSGFLHSWGTEALNAVDAARALVAGIGRLFFSPS